MNIQQNKRPSQIKHEEEFKNEILRPMYIFAGIAIGGTLAVLAFAYFGDGDLSNAADISLIWLTLVLIVVGAIVLAALLFAIMGMGELDGNVDKYAGLVQTKFEDLNKIIRKGNERIFAPLRKLVHIARWFQGDQE